MERLTKDKNISGIKYLTHHVLFPHMIFNITITTLIMHFLGWESMKFHIMYCIYAFIYFQLTDYIEHYGMIRKKDENGVYESISKMHSWNCRSGPILAKLERHSDHHMHGYRPF